MAWSRFTETKKMHYVLLKLAKTDSFMLLFIASITTAAVMDSIKNCITTISEQSITLQFERNQSG